ncbi:MAG: universal stress protein [Vicinamibacterales bacterium]
MTILPKHILVAVDFGDASARAVAIGGVLAARTGARLSLLHTESLDVPPYFTPAQLRALEGEERANAKRAGEYLAAFGRRHTAQPFATLIESRAAVDGILHAAQDADLVVMGTHGRRGPSRWWLGSVAERVLREIHLPLLVVHAGAHDDSAHQVFGRGLVLVEGAAPASRTRQLAGEIAACAEGTVTEVAGADATAARERVGATWAAIPVPVARTGAWRSHVAEPVLQTCSIPVLFVPEADGGPQS